jgi:uncharacterized membrane protein YeaQ/YmgE (transglycosylase-associated protein family)
LLTVQRSAGSTAAHGAPKAATDEATEAWLAAIDSDDGAAADQPLRTLASEPPGKRFGSRRYVSWTAIVCATLLMAAVPAMAHHLQDPSVWLVSWLALGAIAGFTARWFVRGNADAGALDAMLAVVGAMAGGLILAAIGPGPVNVLDIYGIFVAAIAAIAVLLLHDAVIHRRAAG